ncbi:MAG: ABC transporter ATP-binding protein [Chloroflexi bacterium]|nr:ABC transporter ATP-binding protein [Chloroflexota bacterium]
MAEPERVPVWPAIGRLLHLAGRKQGRLSAALLCALLQAGVTIAGNLSLARAIDSVLAGEGVLFRQALLRTVIWMGLALPPEYVRTRAVGIFSEGTMAALRTLVSHRATSLPMAYLESHHTGDLLSVVNADLGRLKALLGHGIVAIVFRTAMALSALGALFSISWALALVSTVMIPLLFMVMSRISAPVAARANRMQEALGQTMGLAQDGLGGLMVTRVFGVAGPLDERFGEANRRVVQEGLGLVRLRTLANAAGSVFGVLPFLITFGFGGWLAISGSLTFGRLVAFINMLNHVAVPLGSLPPAIAVLAAPQEPERYPSPTAGAALPAPDPALQIQFAGARFGFDGSGDVIQGLDLGVKAGSRVAIVGPSGGGKSTLFRLLLGCYPLREGVLYIQGRPLHAWSLEALLQQFAYIPQDCHLYAGSVRENIRYGRPGASHAEVEEAARAANAAGFVRELPAGYDTPVGERGARLSGGQRQRVAIARALLRDAPILLLDEATSALGSESAGLVQAALERFMAGRTTLAIAHRLSSIENADRICVIAEGRVVEQGSQAELLAREGLFRRLYDLQFADADVEAAADAAAPVAGPQEDGAL